ncbi:MAG: hypothetical protein QM771_11290 [Nitrospira sp.]
MWRTMMSMLVSAFMRPSSRRKPVAKFRPTMPPNSRIAPSCQSVRLREWPQIACTLEWVATSGASLKLRDVAKTLLVEMRQVDHDLQLIAGLDQRLAGIGEARPGVGRGGEAERHAIAEGVGPAPDDAQRTQPGGMKHVEHGKPGIDRLDALDMEHGRDRALGHRRHAHRRRCGRR